MADPIFSPDGKWMWSGSEWIPAPPSSSQTANVNLQDSVVGGDINITQNNAEDIATAMVQALERMGFSGQSSPAELTPSQEGEVEKVLEMSEQLAEHGIEIDPWTEILLGIAAELVGKYSSAQQHYIRALETYRKNGDRPGEAKSLTGLGMVAYQRGNLAEAERLYRGALVINTETGDRPGEAKSLTGLGMVAEQYGNVDEQHRYYSQAVQIQRAMGVPIQQWLIDKGY